MLEVTLAIQRGTFVTEDDERCSGSSIGMTIVTKLN